MILRPRIIGVLFGVMVLLAGASAWMLARSQADSRDALRDRFADRAQVATAVVDGLFRSAFTSQAADLDPKLFGGPRVSRATLDAMVRRNQSTFTRVLDRRGRVLGESSHAPSRPGGLRPFERVALANGYGLSDVRSGGSGAILSAVRFRSGRQTRLLTSASPERPFAAFLGTTLEHVASAHGGAFLVDGQGTAIAAVPRNLRFARAVARLPVRSRSGELDSRAGKQVYATAPVSGSDWRTILTVPSHTLYAPAAGPGQWLPWLILLALIAAVLAALVLVRRLADTGSRLAASNVELEFANANLGRSNADLEQFAYVASHDLSSPLRSVSGFSQLLSDRYRGKLDDEADEWIRLVNAGVDRMQRIIDDLLRYSRVETGELAVEPVDLDELLTEVEHSLAPLLEEQRAELTSDPLPTVSAERAPLAQVLQNLIVNGMTYVAPGVAPQIHVSAQPEGAMCRVSVTDNGIGIEPDHTERIFKMFQRLHTEGEHPGSGIGLAIARKIVDRHGGHLGVAAAPGGGSTFAFTVAASRAAPRARTEVLHQ